MHLQHILYIHWVLWIFIVSLIQKNCFCTFDITCILGIPCIPVVSPESSMDSLYPLYSGIDGIHFPALYTMEFIKLFFTVVLRNHYEKAWCFCIVHVRQVFQRSFFKIIRNHKTEVVSDRLYPAERAGMKSLKL